MVGRGCPDLVYLFIIDCIRMCDIGLKVKLFEFDEITVQGNGYPDFPNAALKA